MDSRTILTAFLAISAMAGRTCADEPAQALFSRHVEGVFSRLGCNGGTCHGAVQGQNGFRLSLFAADPALDHERLLRQDGGRRLNLQEPSQSLLLLKATGQVSHQGGARTRVGSADYQVLLRWIAGGARRDSIEASQVRELKITPAEATAKVGESYRLKVEARFADNSSEDVTALCSFETLNDQVAVVDEAGRVQTRGVGDTALIVRYRAAPALAQVLVPREGVATPGADAPGSPANFIDRHVLAKLRRLNVPPAVLADDATFLRRACLDISGELPTPAEVRAFLADTGADKRVKKIDELLARPGHAALWTLKFGDLLKGTDWGGFGLTISTEQDSPRFHAWIRARLEENIPYDQLAERILTATSREGRTLEQYGEELAGIQEAYGPGRPDLQQYAGRQTLDLYWQRNNAHGVSGALQVAHAFLGLRLECAQCHRHPHDVWQQDDLLSFASFFMAVRPVGSDTQAPKKFPELAALAKHYEAEEKKLGQQAKRLRDESKQLEAEAKPAKTELDKIGKEIARLEQKGKTEEAAELKQSAAELKVVVERHEAFMKDVVRLERKSKALAGLPNRILNHEVHILASPSAAKVSSALGTQSAKEFRLLGQTTATQVPTGQDPRLALVEWLRRPNNPYFARAIVNRVWAHYFGRGIIDPPDNLSSFNPASHPELLQELSDGFIRNRYDLRWLHRTIVSSRAYQQSSRATPANELDQANYAYFHYRRLPAEVLIDALNQATGTTEKMGMEQHHWPADMKAVEMPSAPKNAFVNFMLLNFGKPARNPAVQCDCERDTSATMLQVLSLANHPRIWEKVSDPTGRAARIAQEQPDDDQRIEELYLATLSRLPNGGERQACLKYLRESKNATEGCQGILWGLLNTREFLLQH